MRKGLIARKLPGEAVFRPPAQAGDDLPVLQ
jgi:hypothetical protein